MIMSAKNALDIIPAHQIGYGIPIIDIAILQRMVQHEINRLFASRFFQMMRQPSYLLRCHMCIVPAQHRATVHAQKQISVEKKSKMIITKDAGKIDCSRFGHAHIVIAGHYIIGYAQSVQHLFGQAQRFGIAMMRNIAAHQHKRQIGTFVHFVDGALQIVKILRQRIAHMQIAENSETERSIHRRAVAFDGKILTFYLVVIATKRGLCQHRCRNTPQHYHKKSTAFHAFLDKFNYKLQK